jgi:hypothetical protein
MQRIKPDSTRKLNEAKRPVRKSWRKTLLQQLRVTLPNYFTHCNVFTMRENFTLQPNQLKDRRPSPHNAPVNRQNGAGLPAEWFAVGRKILRSKMPRCKLSELNALLWRRRSHSPSSKLPRHSEATLAGSNGLAALT